MYKSPIDIIEKQMRMEFDDGIWKAVQDYAVSVDKEELIKALRYDRDQYEKGYADGKRDAFDKLTKCKDCIYRDGLEDACGNIYCRLHDGRFDKEGYCSYGKEENEE